MLVSIFSLTKAENHISGDSKSDRFLKRGSFSECCLLLYSLPKLAKFKEFAKKIFLRPTFGGDECKK